MGARVKEQIEYRTDDLAVLFGSQIQQVLQNSLVRHQLPHSDRLSRSVNNRMASSGPIHSPLSSAAVARAAQYVSSNRCKCSYSCGDRKTPTRLLPRSTSMGSSRTRSTNSPK